MQQLDYKPLNRKVSLSEKLKINNVPLSIFGMIVSGTIIIAGLIAVPLGALPEIFILMIPPSIVALVFSLITYSGADISLRFGEFAASNNATYESGRPYDERPGMMFGSGHSKKFTDIVTFSNGLIAEIGVFKCTTGSGKSRQDHYYSYVRVKLPRRLPNMILDSKQNNSFGGRLSNLPQGFSVDQHLSLEGDFDSHYNLYVPEQYHRDALYVFTPDVMHALVDSARNYDCEVIDDSFYIFADSPTRPTKLTMIQEMTVIAQRVGREISEQADTYADERIGDRSQNAIAEHGAKIKTHIPPIVIIATLVGMLLLLAQLIDGFM